MIESAQSANFLIAVIAASIFGGYLHEFSHWFVGWLGGADPKFEWTFLFIPNGVDHGKIETMDSTIIRLSGASIFLWVPPGILSFVHLLTDFTPANLFVSMTSLIIVLMTTESDIVAVREPERFRQMWLNDEFQRNAVFVPNWLDADWLPDI